MGVVLVLTPNSNKSKATSNKFVIVVLIVVLLITGNVVLINVAANG